MESDLPALEAHRLTKSYGRSRGIVDVELRVEAGEVMGLVGANGAGKTTLMLSNGFDWTDITVLVAVGLIAVAVGTYVFNHRDLRS